MKKRLLLFVSFCSFIVLGMPDGMLGVAWPSISASFGIPIGSLGVLMVGFTLGYVTTTALVGTIIARFGYAWVMTIAALGLSVGTFGMFVAQWWLLVIASMTVIGVGSGLLDGGLNAYGAAYFRPRDLNWLHAFYGIGATIGPAIMTPMILTDIGWHGGYGIVSAVSTTVLFAFIVTRASWESRSHAASDAASDAGGETSAVDPATDTDSDVTSGTARAIDASPPTDRVPTDRVGLIAIGSVVLFFLYTGLEVVAGQWAFSLFTIERGVPASRAGVWVGVYWGSLTAGRIIFGWISERFPVGTILRTVLVTSVVGIALVFVRTVSWVAPLGLAILGFSLAPMFPLLIGETPKRVGPRLADHLIGFQIAAANIGAVAIVGAVGIGVERFGFELVPVALSVVFVMFAGLHEGLAILARAPQETPERR